MNRSRNCVNRSCTLLLALLLTPLSAVSADEPVTQLALSGVEQAHAELWGRFVDSYGIIHDFAGDLPTPEDCRLGKPNAIGWWSPIEDGPMFTGLYLPAICERARRTGDPVDKEQARRLAAGLMKCASVSDVPGMIVRGVGTDGVCHYPLGSDDQTHPWFYGLHAYVMSDLPAADERREIIAKMKTVANVLESTGWRCPADGAFKGQFRGGYTGHLFRDAVRYLYLLRAMYDVTGEQIWLDRYQAAQAGIPEHAIISRAEICAEGYARDRTAIRHIDTHQLWIYVGSQASLAQLVALETDDKLRTLYRTGLKLNAAQALESLKAYQKFDNQDTKVFGNADWRAVYTTWFPQKTQADAERLARTGDKDKRGKRKSYEQVWMQNPLAAAAIVALADDGSHRDSIEAAINHYDYSKLNMATFFFAECAAYALPAPK
ncbi:hypothetical protein [Gimesia sp.]|uniref:hypothetical protein n=1 Tax=Gimesia sp. TaxID=2024833 RepID=UPI0025C39921|nr:hypothetical protein [Gimesia sp.]